MQESLASSSSAPPQLRGFQGFLLAAPFPSPPSAARCLELHGDHHGDHGELHYLVIPWCVPSILHPHYLAN